jgi:UDP-N-acetylmuramyl pentapeptide phosphotransferase/UDP-N-acetylglucosamine-1-phosphate transferase
MSVADRVTVICCLSLCIVMLATVAVVLVGLFDDRIDNHEIFKLISPSFNMICGAFVGTIAGIRLGKEDQK